MKYNQSAKKLPIGSGARMHATDLRVKTNIFWLDLALGYKQQVNATFVFTLCSKYLSTLFTKKMADI